jgi:hypothetical protein
MQMRIDVFTAETPANEHAATMKLAGWTVDLKKYGHVSFHDPGDAVHDYSNNVWVVIATKP